MLGHILSFFLGAVYKVFLEGTMEQSLFFVVKSIIELFVWFSLMYYLMKFIHGFTASDHLLILSNFIGKSNSVQNGQLLLNCMFFVIIFSIFFSFSTNQ